MVNKEFYIQAFKSLHEHIQRKWPTTGKNLILHQNNARLHIAVLMWIFQKIKERILSRSLYISDLQFLSVSNAKEEFSRLVFWNRWVDYPVLWVDLWDRSSVEFVTIKENGLGNGDVWCTKAETMKKIEHLCLVKSVMKLRNQKCLHRYTDFSSPKNFETASTIS